MNFFRMLGFERLSSRSMFASLLYFELTDLSVFDNHPGCNIYVDEANRLVVDCDGKNRSGEGEPPSDVPTIPPSLPPEVPSMPPDVPVVLVPPPIEVNRPEPQRPTAVVPEVLHPQRNVPLVFMPTTQIPPPQFIEPGVTEPGCILHKEQCRIECLTLEDKTLRLRLLNYEEARVRIHIYVDGEEVAFKQSNPKPNRLLLELDEVPKDAKIEVQVIDMRFPDSCPSIKEIEVDENEVREPETPQTDDCKDVSAASVCALLAFTRPESKSQRRRRLLQQAKRDKLRKLLLAS